jgi:hypothetical protein
MGRPKQAADYHRQDLAISKGMFNARGEANALGDLGNALPDLCRTSEALRYHRKQLRISETTNQPGEVAQALVNLSISLLHVNMEAAAPGEYSVMRTCRRPFGAIAAKLSARARMPDRNSGMSSVFVGPPPLKS